MNDGGQLQSAGHYERMSADFILFAVAISACAMSLGYLVHQYERNRSLALLLTNLLALTAVLAIASKIARVE